MEKDNSAFIKEHKCPACSGTLVFVPEKGKLVCEYCDTEYDIPKEEKKEEAKPQAGNAAEESEFEGFDFTQFYENAKVSDGESLSIYLCKSCGAEVIAGKEEASLTCPYCTNKIVLTDKVSGNIRPDGIIPFKIPQKDLKKHIDGFYKDKKLLPRNFFSASKMERVTGVYVPFWLFSGRIAGKLSYSGKKVSEKSDSNYKYTTTKNYHVERGAEVGFNGIPIDASDKIPDSMMDSVLPYDMNEMVPFQTGYLAGFAADRFDVPGKQLQNRAEGLMKNTAGKLVESSLAGEYTSVSRKGTALKADRVGVKYVLFPVYVFNIKYGKKKYGFAVNGQNGKVVGDLPTDKKVSNFYFFIRFGIVTGLIMAASVISYLCGGAF